MSVPQRKGDDQLWAQLFLSFGQRKPKVRLKSHLLKPEASFEILPVFHRTLMNTSIAF